MRVVPLPEGLDPDDVIKRRGAEGYQSCLDKAMPLIDFKLQVQKHGLDLTKTEDKRAYIAAALKVIAEKHVAISYARILYEAYRWRDEMERNGVMIRWAADYLSHHKGEDA